MQRNKHKAIPVASLVAVGTAIGALISVAQGPAPKSVANRTLQQAGQPPTIRTLSEEVLLDLVARDKHGKPVRDLKPNEIEVFEDGVKQQVTSFRFVGGEAPVVTAAQSGKPQATQALATLGQLNLVSLVFERLGAKGRVNARDAAMAFLKSELRPNVYAAVFTNDKAMFVLQQFTNNRERLEKAVETATTASSSQISAQSASVVRELEIASKAEADAGAAADAASAVANSGQGAGAASLGAAMAEAKMAQMTLETLQLDTVLTREQEGRSSLYDLISLVKEQHRLPGRKTIIYFSEGLNETPALVDLLQTTISEANHSNVSVYSVDARGLAVDTVVGGAQGVNLEGADSAVTINARPQPGLERLSAFDRAGGEEQYEIAARANVQDTLADLSRSTGGFLIANTNEFAPAMQRIAEDIRSYYAVAYRPSTHEYDNKFHRITAKVLRSGVTVQTRSGYFAAPPVGGSPVFAYEMPMLSALKSTPVPQSFDYHDQAFHFQYTPAGLRCRLVVEIPIADFDFKVDASQQWHTHFSVMGLVEGSDGNAALKISQDYPLQGPSERMEPFKKATVTFSRDFTLPPGRYTLETVAIDQESKKASVHRSVLIVPPPVQGVRLSSLSIIGRLDPVNAAAQSNADPLRFQDSEIVPNLGEPIPKGANSGVPLYFVVYPSSQSSEKPQAELELSRGGRVIARAPVELPAADSTGSIRYEATIPVTKFEPGRYQIRAVVWQGKAAAEEFAFFSID